MTLLVTGAVVCRRSPTAPKAERQETHAKAEQLPPPTIAVIGNRVLVDGTEVASTEIVLERQQLTRLDGLFDTLKARRMQMEMLSAIAQQDGGAARRTVFVTAAADVPAIVVKSVFQTAAFAGFDDARFVVDGAAL